MRVELVAKVRTKEGQDVGPVRRAVWDPERGEIATASSRRARCSSCERRAVAHTGARRPARPVPERRR